MHRLLASGLAGTAAAILIAAAAPARADLVFSPPSDWGMSVGGVRGKALATWRSGPAPGSFISVVEDRFGGTLDQYVAFNRTAMAKLHGATFKPSEAAITVCDGTPARLLTFSLQGAGNAPLVAEQLYTGAKRIFYVVSYVRPAGAPAAPDAQRALTTACPR